MMKPWPSWQVDLASTQPRSMPGSDLWHKKCIRYFSKGSRQLFGILLDLFEVSKTAQRPSYAFGKGPYYQFQLLFLHDASFLAFINPNVLTVRHSKAVDAFPGIRGNGLDVFATARFLKLLWLRPIGRSCDRSGNG